MPTALPEFSKDLQNALFEFQMPGCAALVHVYVYNIVQEFVLTCASSLPIYISIIYSIVIIPALSILMGILLPTTAVGWYV